MSDNYFTYKILVNSSDFRIGKADEIKNIFEEVFRKMEDSKSFVKIHPFKSIGVATYAHILIFCNRQLPLVNELLIKYSAEEYQNNLH